MEMMAGIYKIENAVNGKVYVGRAKCLNLRWAVHKSQLKKGVHVNRHLQAAYEKYGIEAFNYSVIEVLYESGILNKEKRNHLKEREQFWADHFDVFNPNKGYNLSPITEGGRMSPETRERLCKANRGENNSNATITNSIAIQICKRISSGYHYKDIAREFGVTYLVVQRIKLRESWKPIGEKYLSPNIRKNQKIPDDCIIDIYKDCLRGVRDKENAAKHNVSGHCVLMIRNGKSHKKLIRKYLESIVNNQSSSHLDD